MLIPVSDDRVTVGHAITDKDLLFIESGVTTKQEVFAHLGPPNSLLEDKRVVDYNWHHVHWGVDWVASLGVFYKTGGHFDIPTHHVLLVQFDEKDRVKKFERTQVSGDKSYETFLQVWIEQD